MSDIQLDDLMTRRLLRAGTASGRAHLLLTVSFRRLLWNNCRNGAALAKRLLDIAGSSILIAAFSPLLALIAALIKLEDGGPVVFSQTRVGKFGGLFKMYKFRSMYVDAEARLKEIQAANQHAAGVTFKMKADPRITRIGKWLRKLSLDELPQLFNVLNGDMSLVGPRPPVPREVALYSQADRRRLNVTPGITCLWQVGGRADLDFPQQVALDVLYIERQSLWTDLKILLKTVPAVITAKGAY